MSPLLMLQKMAGFLVVPAGLLWVGLLWATLRRWRAGGVRAAAGMGVLTLGYTLAGNVHVGHALMRSLEVQVSGLETPSAEVFDAVCVFGGGTELDAFGRPQVACSGDRLVAAARLYHAGKARVLVASGVSADNPSGARNLGEESREIWRGLGVPDSAICVVEKPCRVTREEVVAFRELQEKNGWKQLGLLSSSWHLPRILRLAQKNGLNGIACGSDWRGRRHVFQLQDIVPQGAGFWRVNVALWEYVGRLAGR